MGMAIQLSAINESNSVQLHASNVKKLNMTNAPLVATVATVATLHCIYILFNNIIIRIHFYQTFFKQLKITGQIMK